MEPWIGLIGAVVGGVITLVATYINRREESEERKRDRQQQFKLATYQKCVEAHNNALSFCARLYDALNKPSIFEQTSEADNLRVKADQLAREARQWILDNQSYFTEDTISRFIGWANSAIGHVQSSGDEGSPWRSYTEARDAISQSLKVWTAE